MSQTQLEFLLPRLYEVKSTSTRRHGQSRTLSSIPQAQGQQAQRNGRWAENDIAARLISHGYHQSTAPLTGPQPYFIREKKGLFTNVYGRPMRVDFYVWHPVKYPQGLVIESKRQKRGGSVDEKYYFLIHNLQKLGLPVLLLLLGHGAKKGIIPWCLQQQTDRLRIYTTWEDFTDECNTGLL